MPHFCFALETWTTLSEDLRVVWRGDRNDGPGERKLIEKLNYYKGRLQEIQESLSSIGPPSGTSNRMCREGLDVNIIYSHVRDMLPRLYKSFVVQSAMVFGIVEAFPDAIQTFLIPREITPSAYRLCMLVSWVVMLSGLSNGCRLFLMFWW